VPDEPLRVNGVVGSLGDDGKPLADLAAAFGCVLGDELERLAIEAERLVLRPAAVRLFRAHEQVFDRAFRLAGLPPVVRERRRDVARFARSPFQELGNCPVSFGAQRPRQDRICHLADELVPERELLLSLEA